MKFIIIFLFLECFFFFLVKSLRSQIYNNIKYSLKIIIIIVSPPIMRNLFKKTTSTIIDSMFDDV